jgi:protein-disulfide isomerase
MASNDVAEELSKTAELAQRMKISGTPTFVMQDEMLRGYLPLDSMQAMLRDKRG